MAKRRPTVLRIGSVSHGTMRPEDLIPSFLWECRRIRLTQAERRAVRQITRDMHRNGYFDTEEAADDCAVLFDILDAHCPDYCTFGAHEGDGSDYGVWPSLDAVEDDSDVFKGDYRDAPKSARYALEVNDHRNATLYRRAGNRWVECWSVV